MQVDVLRAINAQINSEFRAWYQYLAMAAFCPSRSRPSQWTGSK